MKLLTLFFFLLVVSIPLFSEGFQSNVLLHNDTVQISSEINVFENLVPGNPINGSVMVTHDAQNLVDSNSFKIGNKPLKVQFVRSVPMSDQSQLVVSIYQFQLEGMKAGSYTLQPITVKVGNKNYAAPPLSFQVGN